MVGLVTFWMSGNSFHWNFFDGPEVCWYELSLSCLFSIYWLWTCLLLLIWQCHSSHFMYFFVPGSVINCCNIWDCEREGEMGSGLDLLFIFIYFYFCIITLLYILSPNSYIFSKSPVLPKTNETHYKFSFQLS